MFPKAQIAASFVAVFFDRHHSIKDVAATFTNNPSNRMNIIVLNSMSASVKVVIPKLFLIFLFPKTAIRHFVSYSFLFIFYGNIVVSLFQ